MQSTNPLAVFGRVRYAILSLVAVVILNSLVLLYAAPGEFWGWLSTLLATVLSVAAFLVGVALYSYLSNDADAKRREDLRSLVRSELEETITSFSRFMAATGDDRDTEGTEEPPIPDLGYVQPLILEEAAKSGLFSRETTFEMLRLAKTMRSYNVHMDQATAYAASAKAGLFVYHGVSRTGHEIVEGCRRMLASAEIGRD